MFFHTKINAKSKENAFGNKKGREKAMNNMIYFPSSKTNIFLAHNSYNVQKRHRNFTKKDMFAHLQYLGLVQCWYLHSIYTSKVADACPLFDNCQVSDSWQVPRTCQISNTHQVAGTCPASNLCTPPPCPWATDFGSGGPYTNWFRRTI